MTVHQMTQVDPVVVHSTAAQTATFNSSSLDLQGYVGEVQIIAQIGVVSGTTPSLAGTIQDSADNSVFAELATPITVGAAVTATTAIRKADVQVNGVRRFIRYTGTITGTTPSFTIGVIAAGFKGYKP